MGTARTIIASNIARAIAAHGRTITLRRRGATGLIDTTTGRRALAELSVTVSALAMPSRSATPADAPAAAEEAEYQVRASDLVDGAGVARTPTPEFVVIDALHQGGAPGEVVAVSREADGLVWRLAVRWRR